MAAPDEIAVADDRLQRAVDLGRDRQRQLRHDLHRPMFAERHVQLLRDPGDGENLGDRLQRVDVRLRERVGCRETTFSVPTARPRETSGIRSTDWKPDVMQDVGVEVVGRRGLDVADDHRLARSNDAAEDRALDLEDDLRPWPRPALFLLHARGVGLELPSVFGEERQADTIARREPGDPRGERLEGERDVDRARDDVEHRVLRLQLIDFGQRCAVILLLLREPARERGDPARGDGRERQQRDPHDQQRDERHGMSWQSDAERTTRAVARRRTQSEARWPRRARDPLAGAFVSVRSRNYIVKGCQRRVALGARHERERR